MNSGELQKWLKNLAGFLKHDRAGFKSEWAIQAPASEEQITDIEMELKRPIPQCFRSFLEQTARVEFRWRYETESGLKSFAEPLGGALTLDLNLLTDHRQECSAWANESWIAEYEEDQAFWSETFPFAALGNGDYLALHATVGGSDPAVVYLNHEDKSKVIARSLGEFLRQWEKICYLGPEIGALEAFLDPTSGLLIGQDAETQRLRSSLYLEQKILR